MIRLLARLFAALFGIGVLVALGAVFLDRAFTAEGPQAPGAGVAACGATITGNEEELAFAAAEDPEAAAFAENARPAGPPGTVVTIPAGAGVSEIARILGDRGVLAPDREWVFIWGSRLRGGASRLKAGQYLIPPFASAADIMNLLVSNRTLAYPVTVPEGRTSAQIVAQLNADTRFGGPPLDVVPPEGSLLPDTYNISCGDPRRMVVDAMTAEMQETLAELWAARDPDLPLATPEEALTLASIIEKETGVASERPQVASVFVNRLRRGMPLQTDPTVIYALSDGTGELGRPLTRADYRFEHPYNTYMIPALPPGPIANPGRAAIAAALHPDETPYLFFVAIDDQNPGLGHAFATTEAEHNRNVADLDRLRAERRQQQQ